MSLNSFDCAAYLLYPQYLDLQLSEANIKLGTENIEDEISLEILPKYFKFKANI